MELTVASFNIRHGRGNNLKVDLSRIAEVIRKEQIDIAGLNEVDCRFSKRSDYADQVTALADQLQMYKEFAPAITKGNKRGETAGYGNAILSRFPIEKATRHLVPGSRFIEGRSILEATIEMQKRKVTFFVTHFSLYPPHHRLHTKKLLEHAVACRTPTIIMGDWNCTARSRRLRKIRTVFHEVNKRPIATVPSIFPMFQLDYIFASEHFTPLSVYASSSDRHASDHLALVAKLQLYEEI